jgi:type 1 glutamine amidotransferase
MRAAFLEWSLCLLAALGVNICIPSTSQADEPVKPLRALLVIGGCCHDYKAQKDLLAKGISDRARVEVVIAYDPDTTTKHLNPVYENADWAKGFDVVIHDECSADVKDPAIIERILAPHREGLPAIVLHCGMHCYRSEGFPNVTPWFEFTGLLTTGHGPQAPIEIHNVAAEHPVMAGWTDWTTINEELYNNITGHLQDTATPLARGVQTTKNKKGDETTADNVLIWTNSYHGTPVFATTLGHNNQTVNDPRYLDLVTRGLLWSCGKLNHQYMQPLEKATTSK